MRQPALVRANGVGAVDAAVRRRGAAVLLAAAVRAAVVPRVRLGLRGQPGRDGRPGRARRVHLLQRLRVPPAGRRGALFSNNNQPSIRRCISRLKNIERVERAHKDDRTGTSQTSRRAHVGDDGHQPERATLRHDRGTVLHRYADMQLLIGQSPHRLVSFRHE
jgi:hypothetical protein